MLPLYIGAAGAILLLGQTLYCRWRIKRLEAMVANVAPLEAAVKARDEKITSLEDNLKEKNAHAHAQDVEEASHITTPAGAIGFLRDSLGGERKGP